MTGATSEDHAQVDPAESLMREVGAQLRQRRLERGEDLDDVAQHLRIRSAYLFALEQGDLGALPGRPYALGFLRSYADYLGFDGDDLVTRIKATVADLTDRTRLRVRVPMPENRLPKTPVVVISLAVVAGVYAGWSLINRDGRMAVDEVAEVPGSLRERTVEMASPQETRPLAAEGPASNDAAGSDQPSSADAAGAADGTTAAEAAEGGVMPQAGLATPETGERAVDRSPEVLSVQPAAGDRAAEPAAARGARGARTASEVLAALVPGTGGPDGPQVYERANADARVVLRAREPAWIRVSSATGDYSFTRTLEPGDVLLVPNRSDLELWTGNAGGLEVIVDGTAVPVLAGGGAVRRNVSLDPERLRAAADGQP